MNGVCVGVVHMVLKYVSAGTIENIGHTHVYEGTCRNVTRFGGAKIETVGLTTVDVGTN